MGLVVKVKRKCLMIRIRVEWSVASVVERVWCGRVVWRRNVKAVRTFRGGEVGGKTRNREGIYPFAARRLAGYARVGIALGRNPPYSHEEYFFLGQ
jgi:hypothetical protein